MCDPQTVVNEGMHSADPEWTEPPAHPTLTGNSVHVWLADLRELLPELDRLTSVLSPDERQRAARFRTEPLRQRYKLTRGMLRCLIARYAKRPAIEIAFVYNEHGKPLLDPHRPEPALHFNASHSGDYAAFAFARAGRIGVDIEQVRADAGREEIARRFFAPGEASAIAALPANERAPGFFTCWTRKEAFIKARGDGIFAGLHTFEVTATHREAARLLRVEGDPGAPDRWWMKSLPLIHDCAVALAVEAHVAEISCFRCPREAVGG